MKIYTRTGDDGSTDLFGGERVPKDDPRIAAYGTVDEANSLVGLARAHLDAENAAAAPPPAGDSSLDDVLGRLQEDLFTVGADLATPLGSKPVVPRVEAAHVERLETDIDVFDEELPELKQFILPGGARGGATLHAARTVCRQTAGRPATTTPRTRSDPRVPGQHSALRWPFPKTASRCATTYHDFLFIYD
ncbi:MAG: ATP:cob(I)alamin adenosyltransferase [Bacteroidetes bacterium QS_1_65_9]|nr:MAG: ATP:cob(I)alamin adenosyltransferase [Bacteroidetes bacterium QS_1_65_9]